MRRRFRFWLRGSSFSYFVRSLLFGVAVWFIRAVIVLTMAKNTHKLLTPTVGLYVDSLTFWTESSPIVWMLKFNTIMYSLFTGLFCWRFFDQVAIRMGLEKLTPQRRMRHWSKQIEVIIY